MSDRTYLDRLQQKGYRPRFLADGTPCNVVEQGHGPYRTFVATIPKAGTYLIAEVLSALGLRNCMLHLDPPVQDGEVRSAMVSDYREYFAGAQIWKYSFLTQAEDGLPLVLPGQFVVGHLPPAEYLDALSSFQRVFLFRELRHVLISWARFAVKERIVDEKQSSTLPDLVWGVLQHRESAWLLPNVRDMIGWLTIPDTFPIRFEDLVGENGAGAQADTVACLVRHLKLPTDAEHTQVARGCVGRQTLTYSGARSELSRGWDARLEQWFRKAGGPELNKTLGYKE